MTGIIVSGFGLSAFVFSTIAHTIFPGNTSGFLLTLALGTAFPMVLGWLLIRPCPYPERTTSVTIEGNNREEPDDTSLLQNETTQLIRRDDRAKSPSITGLTLIRTIDFWILFCIMSLCECFCHKTGVFNRNAQVTGSGIMCEQRYFHRIPEALR